MSVIFVLTNIMIAVSYAYLAFVLMPILPVRRSTVVAGVGFFLFCAGTHLDIVWHTLWAPDETYGETSRAWHMFLIHAPQMVFSWVFAVGFVRDMKALARERHTTRHADE